jgi:hypothetical protein
MNQTMVKPLHGLLVNTLSAPTKPSSDVIHARNLKRLSTTDRALATLDLATGAKTASDLTRTQAAEFAGVPASYVATAARATEAERDQMRRGTLTISELHHRKRAAKTLTDSEIDRIVGQVGAQQLLAWLDRATAPRAQAAE